jgi:hypothetical protein
VLADVADGSFWTDAANSAARPTSALPLKLTSVTDENLVAAGQEETKRDLNSRRRCHWQFFPWLLAWSLHAANGLMRCGPAQIARATAIEVNNH